MRKIRQLLHLIPMMLGWAVLSAIFWGWIFTIVTTVGPNERIVISVDANVRDAVVIASDLEKDKPSSIKRIRVLPFDYAVMSTNELESADIFIIHERDMDELKEWFITIPESLSSLQPDTQDLYLDMGILLNSDGILPYQEDIYYEKQEDGTYMHYYLCIGKNGVHLLSESG